MATKKIDFELLGFSGDKKAGDIISLTEEESKRGIYRGKLRRLNTIKVVGPEKKLAEKDALIAELNNKLAEKDALIAELNNKLAEKDALIADLNKNNKQKQ